MRRRALLRFGVGVAAFGLLGHRPGVLAADQSVRRREFLLADLEPDRLWSIYRRHRLMIVGQRDDRAAFALAGAVVDALNRYLPGSRAQLARAADTRRVGVLIATNQQDVAIMASESAEALFLARPPFDDVHDVPLRLIVAFGNHVVVCRAAFETRDAYLVAQALAEHNNALLIPANPPRGLVPAHRGSRAFFAGEAIPNAGPSRALVEPCPTSGLPLLA